MDATVIVMIPPKLSSLEVLKQDQVHPFIHCVFDSGTYSDILQIFMWIRLSRSERMQPSSGPTFFDVRSERMQPPSGARMSAVSVGRRRGQARALSSSTCFSDIRIQPWEFRGQLRPSNFCHCTPVDRKGNTRPLTYLCPFLFAVRTPAASHCPTLIRYPWSVLPLRALTSRSWTPTSRRPAERRVRARVRLRVRVRVRLGDAKALQSSAAYVAALDLSDCGMLMVV